LIPVGIPYQYLLKTEKKDGSVNKIEFINLNLFRIVFKYTLTCSLKDAGIEQQLNNPISNVSIIWDEFRGTLQEKAIKRCQIPSPLNLKTSKLFTA